MNTTTRVLLAAALVASLAACTKKTKEEAPVEAAPAPVETAPVDDGRYDASDLDTDSCLKQRVVYFDFDQDVIKAEFTAIMACHAKYLQDQPSARITLEGNADERGTREYNRGLGERRGNSVSAALQGNGGSASQLSVVSYGEERPASRYLQAFGAAALMAAASASAVAQTGRLSLGERVARLEQQAQGGQSSVELLNRITELQAEVQTLRGLVEQQNYKIQELEKRNRDQYVDLDTRLAKLESGRAGTGAPLMDPEATPMTPSSTLPTESAAPAPSGVFEEPIVQPPADAGVETQPASSVEPGVVASVVDPMDERQSYEDAFGSLKEGRYAEAARRFQSFIDRYPNGDYSPNAQYWLGESYYVTQNYQIALEAFQRLLSQFPSSGKAPDALLKVGYCHYELKHWPQAESTLNQVVQTYPDTTVARLAQGRLRALQLENR